MIFLVAIHKDPGSSYGISVPDLPGCVTAGDTIAEALILAKDAIKLHLEGLLEDGLELPEPVENLDQLRGDPDYADAIWGAVLVDLDWRRGSTAAA